MLTPALFERHLSPIIVAGPAAILIGVYVINMNRGLPLPRWVLLNATSLIVVGYSGYAVGITLPFRWLVVAVFGFFIFDILAVKTGTMQSMSESLLPRGLPIMFLIPHRREFDFEEFGSIISSDGLEGLHGSQHGAMMLGVGDLIIPVSLAISFNASSTSLALGPLSTTFPKLGTVIGGAAGLLLFAWVRLPRAIAALTIAVPSAFLGLAIGIVIDPTITVIV